MNSNDLQNKSTDERWESYPRSMCCRAIIHEFLGSVFCTKCQKDCQIVRSGKKKQDRQCLTLHHANLHLHLQSLYLDKMEILTFTTTAAIKMVALATINLSSMAVVTGSTLCSQGVYSYATSPIEVSDIVNLVGKDGARFLEIEVNYVPATSLRSGKVRHFPTKQTDILEEICLRWGHTLPHWYRYKKKRTNGTWYEVLEPRCGWCFLLLR